MTDDRLDGRAAAPADAMSAAMTRLALRQLNQRALLPVLLHEVNGGLNGVALSAELLSRLLASPASQPEAAGGLMQRTRTELTRLKHSIKELELRLAAPDGDPAPTTLVAMVRDVRALLAPAMRRGQLEWRAPQDDVGAAVADARVSAAADEAFQLLVGQAIVAIESAAPGATLSLDVALDGRYASVEIGRTGPSRVSLALELHRELLRRAVGLVGGEVTWQGARSRLALPRIEA